MCAKYHQGKLFINDKNIREKYYGDADNIVFRSSWEEELLKYFLLLKCVNRMNSEEVVVRYISPVDNKTHRYFIDIWVEIKTKSGKVKQALIEVKPYNQMIPPKKTYSKKGKFTPKREATYNKKMNTYKINIAKWKAAKAYCDNLDEDIDFFILTDNPKVNFQKATRNKYKLWDMDDVQKFYEEGMKNGG